MTRFKPISMESQAFAAKFRPEEIVRGKDIKFFREIVNEGN